MEIKLEQLEYQQQAIESVVSVFTGQYRNTFDNSCHEGVRSNYLSLAKEEIHKNIRKIQVENKLTTAIADPDNVEDLCVEMETGTGKTLVYIKTIFELYRRFGFTKFIILVPSVAIKEGVLKTLNTFSGQLAAIYNFRPDYFEYDSKKLARVTRFVEEQHPQVMVMTLQSFNSDDRILNQSQREYLFSNMPFIEALAKTNPIIFMDEPQEGMDTDNSVERIKTLNPLIKIRYSATHKILKNLVYRLTPFESYKQGLVKKIEVLTVSEKNDEASMKIELTKIELGKGAPKAVLKLWHQTASGFKFKNSKKLGKNDSLYDASGNVIYKDFIIEQIARPIRSKGFVKFKNGAIVYEGEQSKDYSEIFGEQLYWLIDTHFRKREELKKSGIKCLSLIFIDRVSNYIEKDGVIKKTFEKQYRKVYKEHFETEPDNARIENSQGYYFAQTGKGDFTDNERSMKNNKELFDLILKDKERLLDLENPVEFIFSHSALGVGWDNPNVFNIATLNQSYSEIKKRQEIGRGLRICIDQDGRRVYDKSGTPEGAETNLLTIVPNETYETFLNQYQSEIEEVYGTAVSGAEIRNIHKGKRNTEKKIKRNDDIFNNPSFKNFWSRLAQKTEYTVDFDEETLISESAIALDEIEIPDHLIEISLRRISGISEMGIKTEDFRSESRKSGAVFSKISVIEELSDKSCLAMPTVNKIFSRMKNRRQFIKNPPRFIQEAAGKIKNIELDIMLRALEYSLTGETFDITLFEPFIIKNSERIEPTPLKGVYDHIAWDSEFEQKFAREADTDNEIVCFLKLPDFYRIKTPAGFYNPDFGVVMKKRRIRGENEEEYYFVIETKGTNLADDRKAMTENEIYKIKCAVKHFNALGIETKVNYIAPVKDYSVFKEKAAAIEN